MQKKTDEKQKAGLFKHLATEFHVMLKPTPVELARLTGLVMGLAIVSAVVIGVFDFAFVELLRLFL